MRALLLHPEDSPVRGRWSQERWDLVVDLGNSSQFSSQAWSEKMRCPMLRAASFRRGIEDLATVREALLIGRRKLMDDEGIDWWDLTSLLIAPELHALLILERAASEIPPTMELWATRSDWRSQSFALLCNRPLRAFSSGTAAGLAARAIHYASLIRRFSGAQIREIVFDKYDSGYRWRSRFASSPPPLSEEVTLLPSAYANVSRMAAAYARVTPEKQFLLIATRRSARQFDPPPNVTVRDLASYAKGESPREVESVLKGWTALRTELSSRQELRILAQTGILEPFPQWLREGLRARDAWRRVIEVEPVSGVLCGDDSNVYTRLPVLLASRRKIPTVDFHHGALDGRYLLKDLPSDVYLAKNEMERDYLLGKCALPAEKVKMGAPWRQGQAERRQANAADRDSIILFSEPYEAAGMRAEEVYRELLPPLCHLAEESGRSLIVKLHPFESLSDRRRLIRALVSSAQYRSMSVLEGPLSEKLLSRAWCGITVESTTVIDCQEAGVPCFLCAWLVLSPFEYVQQYARFGMGQILRQVEDVKDIPDRVTEFYRNERKQKSWEAADPDDLRSWLGANPAALSAGR